MKTKILIPINFSDKSINLIQFADRWAQTINAKLLIVHVVPLKLGQSFQQNLSQSDALKHHLSHFRLNSEYEFFYTQGALEREVLDLENELNPDIILLQEPQNLGLFQHAFGSVADRIIEKSNHSIYVYDELACASPKRILVPIELNRYSNMVVSKAVDWAKLHHSKLYFVYVYPENDKEMMDMPGATAISSETIINRLKNKLETYVKNRSAEVPYQTVFKVGDFETEILQAQEQTNADLLMMRAYTEGPSGDIVNKSNTESLLHQSDLPLYLIKKKQTPLAFEVASVPVSPLPQMSVASA